MNKEALELSVIAGKIAIEHTKLHPIVKVSINFEIDQVAKFIKEEYSSDIEKICSAAKQYDIYKVIAISFPMLNGQNLMFLRAYGGNPTAFFNQLNIQIVPENTGSDMLKNISELEKNSGVVIYEKD